MLRCDVIMFDHPVRMRARKNHAIFLNLPALADGEIQGNAVSDAAIVNHDSVVVQQQEAFQEVDDESGCYRIE
ncbi:hypothetical protein [Ferrimicrobium acidiphilum]|uniref:hypothetical protein n=1 Tax=Ferrimicrobium acidiphilum TaxID=121039 RepID=UPI0023F16A4E|nr:hypothetical protein [Ferrimicrobium acidiphilum]